MEHGSFRSFFFCFHYLCSFLKNKKNDANGQVVNPTKEVRFPSSPLIYESTFRNAIPAKQ
jgi:hypothetical protein